MHCLQSKYHRERGRSILHMQQFNAFKTLKDPPHGRIRRGFVHLIGNALLKSVNQSAECGLYASVEILLNQAVGLPPIWNGLTKKAQLIELRQ